MSLRVVITVADATLPEAQRQVVLDGLAAELAAQLAQFYSGISVEVEPSFAVGPNGETPVDAHEITSSVYGAYYGVYGGS